MMEVHEAYKTSRRRWFMLVPLAFLVLAGLLGRALYTGNPDRLPSALLGRPVPQMALPPLAGVLRAGAPVGGVATQDLKSNGVTVVNVFASWCGPCQLEHPFLMKFAAMNRARLIGINYKDDAENARRYLGTFGNPYQLIGVDEKGRSAIDWGVYGIPETFIINRDGVIVDKIIGPLDEKILTEKLVPAVEAAARQSAM